jgi:hypothetical protein
MLAGLVEPDGVTADRDHALGAVDSAVALGAGLVGGDVVGLVIAPPVIRNIGNRRRRDVGLPPSAIR